MKQVLQKILENKLAKWAKKVIDRTNPQVIAITGSIAKTSTKETIYQVLNVKYGAEVGSTPGNMNNELGMPLAILGFKKPPRMWEWPFVFFTAWLRSMFHRCSKIMILEMGADKPGDIEHLVSIVKPNFAVVTIVGASHLAQFGSIEKVAKEKEVLVKSLPKDGTAIINGNDRLAVGMAGSCENKPILFFPKIDEIAQEAARAVGRLFNVSEEGIEEGIKRAGVMGRLEVIEGVNGSVIIDDSYNANPLSMEVALYRLSKIAWEKKLKRKIAILGDMLELGEYAEVAHKELVELAKKEADMVVGVGFAMRKVETDKWFDKSDDVLPWLLKEIVEGDIILVKGSHGIHLDQVVEGLRRK